VLGKQRKGEKMNIIFSTPPTEFDVKPITPTSNRATPKDVRKEAVEIAPLKREEIEIESRQAILKETLAQHEISMKISKDESTGQIIVKLIDDKTGEEVQQFPTEASLKLSEVFTKIQGQFLEKRV
jgi:uncharacterized FlaG/YvyC family protein